MVLVAHGCATASLKPTAPESIRGIASWYGEEFAGRVTASGEIFDPLQLTAAHRALPFGTIAVVTNMETGATDGLFFRNAGIPTYGVSVR